MKFFVYFGLSVLLYSSFAACGGNPHMERVRIAGAQARSRPGSAQVVAYVRALQVAYRKGALDKHSKQSISMLEEALAMLDSAARKSSGDTAELLGYKGVLLVTLSREKPAWEAFHQSMQVHPTYLAASNIVAIYGAGNKPDKVAETSSLAAPYIAKVGDVNEFYRFIETCNQNMNALNQTTAFAWANEGTKKIYFAFRKQKDRETTRYIQEAQAQRAYENRVVHSVEICALECEQQAHLCQADCGRHQSCRNDCVGANNACVNVCGARAKRELGLDPAFTSPRFD